MRSSKSHLYFVCVSVFLFFVVRNHVVHKLRKNKMCCWKLSTKSIIQLSFSVLFLAYSQYSWWRQRRFDHWQRRRRWGRRLHLSRSECRRKRSRDSNALYQRWVIQQNTVYANVFWSSVMYVLNEGQDIILRMYQSVYHLYHCLLSFTNMVTQCIILEWL